MKLGSGSLERVLDLLVCRQTQLLVIGPAVWGLNQKSGYKTEKYLKQRADERIISPARFIQYLLQCFNFDVPEINRRACMLALQADLAVGGQ